MVTDLESIQKALNKVGYIVMSNFQKKMPLGDTFEKFGQKFIVIGYATEEEVQNFCDAAERPFLHKRAFHHKVITD